MMEINRTLIRTLSILGQRGAFGYTLKSAGEENSRIIALTADLCNTSGLDRFREAFPERLINVGIAEQNLIGVSAGLAAGGFIPFCTTFSNFAALRSCEQIRHFLGYMKENVKVVGFAGGFAMGMFGITHYGIEDIAAIRSVSNITIFSPCDGLETAKATMAAAQHDGPVYIRLTGVMNQPIVYKEDYAFETGKAVEVKGGTDIVIFATGGMVHRALQAAKRLDEEGLSCRVVNIHTIKPLDIEAVKKALGARLVVTVEEHSVTGGLGSAVAEALAGETVKPPQLLIGVSGEYKSAGTYEYMLEQYGLTGDQIYNKISDKIRGLN